MSGPLDGIRVVELGVFVAAPSAAMIFADWGADVIKIEPPGGDPWRRNRVGKPAPGMAAPLFELDNRGKRSIVLDLKQAEDLERAYRLIGSADVFITNVRPRAVERLALDAASLRTRFPSLIALQITGYGLDGPDADLPGYDVSAFWARAGYAPAMGEPGQPPVMPRPAAGDHTTGLAAVAAVCAALYRRAVSGAGETLQVSLASVGAYVQGSDHIGLLQGGWAPIQETRTGPVTPLLNTYQAGDGRWVLLACVDADRDWPGICALVDRPGLLEDERFRDNRTRFRNSAALVDILDAAFATRDAADWVQLLAGKNIVSGIVNDVADAHADPQYAALGTFPSYVDARTDAPVRTVDSPVQFGSAPRDIRRGAPGLGEHTDEILAELDDDANAGRDSR